MPLGSWPAGSVYAGGDVFTQTPSVEPVSAAARIDVTTRVVVVTDDGSIATVHFVDQQVALALSVPLGSVPSSPGLGVDLSTIRRATRLTADLSVKDATTRALATLTARRSISIGQIKVQYRVGSIAWEVSYKNLVAPAPQSRTARVNFGG